MSNFRNMASLTVTHMAPYVSLFLPFDVEMILQALATGNNAVKTWIHMYI